MLQQTTINIMVQLLALHAEASLEDSVINRLLTTAAGMVKMTVKLMSRLVPFVLFVGIGNACKLA